MLAFKYDKIAVSIIWASIIGATTVIIGSFLKIGVPSGTAYMFPVNYVV